MEPLTQAIGFLLVQSLVAIVGYSTCSFLIDIYGRRPVLFLYYLVGAGCHLWFAMASGAWMYAAIAAIGWLNPGVFGGSIIYTGELYPTRLRATAVGWFFGLGRVGSFLAPTVIGFMLAGGLGDFVLHTFAIAYLIAAFATIAERRRDARLDPGAIERARPAPPRSGRRVTPTLSGWEARRRHVPLYMDTHERVRAITMEGVTRAYERSLEVQAQHGARYLKMWVHEDPDDHGRLYCLMEAPSREAVTLVHLDAHGMLPNEIHEVVEAPQELPPAFLRGERSAIHA